jgi:sugar (pentulose or hexulose) kinase
VKQHLSENGEGARDIGLGIDFGTSGAQAIAIDSQRNIVAQSSDGSGEAIDSWRSALGDLLEQLPQIVRSKHRVRLMALA